MIRCTIEILPGGSEERKRTLGLVEIANIGGDLDGRCDYAVVLKKSPPFSGALKQAWRKGLLEGTDVVDGAASAEDDEAIVSKIEGFHRVQRGVYDLLFQALSACGLAARNR